MMRNVALGLITLSLAVAYLVATLDVPRSALDGPVGARGFPNLIGWTLAGVSLLLIAHSLLVRPAAREGGEETSEAWATPGPTALRAAGFTAIAVAYLIALPILGYVISTCLLIAAGVRYQDRRPMGQVLIVSVVGAVAFWLLFVKLLGIPLPAGLTGRWF